MRKIIFIIIFFIIVMRVSGQDNKPVTRMAVITIDLSKLKEYIVLLQEQMQTAVKVEPGVISYHVYADKSNPAKLTIIEMYESNSAYLAHRETPHFKKYKDAVNNMVKSLELSEVDNILTASKENQTGVIHYKK